MKFRFRLQRVLDWHAKLYSMEEDRMHECVRAVAEVEERIARHKAEFLGIEQEWLRHAAYSPADIRALAEHRTAAAKAEKALARDRWSRVNAADEQRRRLVAERRKVRTLEAMSDRARHEAERAADKQLEAMATEAYLAGRIADRRAR